MIVFTNLKLLIITIEILLYSVKISVYTKIVIETLFSFLVSITIFYLFLYLKRFDFYILFL